MANAHVCFGSSVNANTNTTSPVGIRKCNNSTRIIKLRWHASRITSSDTLSPFPAAWGSSHTLMFDITVTYNCSLSTRMYICWCPNQRYVWIEKLQRGGEKKKERKGGEKNPKKKKRKKKIRGSLPYFRNNFYWRQESQEKHWHDLSHTCSEVSILSGCVSISTAEPAATEVTEGCVPQFGTAPSTTFEMCTAV